MIDGFIKMMKSPDDFVGPVNLGNPAEFSIAELARKIIDITGSKSKIEYKPLPADDPIQRQPDIHLAVKRLQWRPMVGIEEGLEKTIEYFKKLRLEL